MTATYFFYGLTIQADTLLPGFRVAEPNLNAVDIHVWFREPAEYAAVYSREQAWADHPLYQDRRPQDEQQQGMRIFVSPDGEYTRLHYSTDVIFTVNRQATQIFVQAPPDTALEMICAYFVNPVLAFCLRSRGLTCLHASGVVVNGRALIFVAPSGSGKSTFAFQFAKHGHTILSDDICTLVDTPEGLSILPGYPHLRLWSWTVEELLGDENALPLIAPDWEKRYVDLNRSEYTFAASPVPLGAVFMLDGFSDRVSIVPIPNRLALMTLMNNTYLNYMIDHKMRSDDFRWLSRLTHSVPVYSMIRPEDMERIEECYQAVHDMVVASPEK